MNLREDVGKGVEWVRGLLKSVHNTWDEQGK